MPEPRATKWENCPTLSREHHTFLHESIDSLFAERDRLRVEVDALAGGLHAAHEVEERYRDALEAIASGATHAWGNYRYFAEASAVARAALHKAEGQRPEAPEGEAQLEEGAS